MSVDIKIVNKGIFKKKLNMQNFLETGLQAGIMDNTWRMQPLEAEAAEDFILYDPMCIARGIQVVWKQPYEVELYLLLPTCHQEIDAFYELIQRICKCWKTSAFEQDGETQELRNIAAVKKHLSAFSDECLDSFLQEHEDGCFFQQCIRCGLNRRIMRSCRRISGHGCIIIRSRISIMPHHASIKRRMDSLVCIR